MSQPQQPGQDGSGEIIAAAVLGLALIALETRTRQQVQNAIADAYKVIAATAIAIAATQPGVILTGLALLAVPAMHAAIVRNLAEARQQVTAEVGAGYTAATHIAHAKLAQDLNTQDYQVPAELPTLDPTLDRILQDVDTLFGHAQTDIQDSLVDAFDGITGEHTRDAQTVAVNQALHDAQARTQQRANAAATTAVHRGSTDAQQAIFGDFQNHVGTGLMKRWKTTSGDPCGMCEALDGTTVAVSAEFDHDATTDPADWRRVWRNLLGPPRHPNCRCQIELIHIPGGVR